MDPNIMKLLEEDEDETMHSGADVDAFQAALNRDIGGDSSASQPSGSGSAVLSHESNQTSSQSFPNWETTRQDGNIGGPSQQESKVAPWEQQEEQHPSVMEPKTVATWEQQEEQHPSVMEPKTVASAENQRPKSGAQVQQVGPEQAPFQTPQTTPLQIPETNPVPGSVRGKQQISHSESQYLMSPKMGNQQTTAGEQGGNQKSGKQVAFVTLLPALLPHLDKDREMQLQTLFSKLRRNEIPKENFVRLVRNIVGDQVLKLAVQQLQAQQGSNQSQQSQALARKQNVRMPVSATATRYTDPRPYALQPRGSSSTLNPLHNTPSVVHVQPDSSYSFGESNAKKSHETERQLDSHGMQGSQMPSSSNSLVNQERERNLVSNQGQIKEQPQQLHLPQTSFPMYGTTVGNYHQFSGASGTTGSSMNQQPYDLQMRQNSVNEPNRAQSGNTSHFPNQAVLQQNSISWQTSQNKEQNSASLTDNVKQEPVEQASEQQHKSQLSNLQGMSIAAAEQGNTISGNVKDAISVSPSFTSSLESNVQVGSRIPTAASSSGNNMRTPPKKPSIGQKKPLEALGSSPPMASNKKQKVSGALSDQSIEQLNDVTAVSGVNLREEEEQLFSGSKEDSRVSEASRRVVQEEEERLILQKTPLQKKLAEIMAKCGLKNVSNDVERCLSLCVEERMRGLISNLIRLSKQRADTEKLRHRTIITSDVRQQIVTINRKAREEWEKKQAEAEKLRKVNEPEGDSAVEGDKEKDEGRAKSVKVNKEEDDKMRTTAANVAARAAVGGDDMLSKWQLMAEQARQKREGGMEAASVSQPGKDVSRRLLSTSGRQMKDNQETEKRSPSALISSSGAVRKFGRNQVSVPQVKVAQNISFKDVIAVLEREPQMSKSTLIYQLYERIQSDTATE